MAQEEKGYVYILTNPAFRENWVKIGKSSRPVDVRSKELDNTAVPLPFQIYATMCTVKYAEAEKLVHKYIERFTNLRIRNNREFFNVKPEDALEIFYDVQLVIDDAEIEVFQDKAPKSKHKSKKEQAKPEQHIFYCKRARSDAQGYYKEETDEFVVLAGSELRSGECDSLKPQSIEKRNAFIKANFPCTDDLKKSLQNFEYKDECTKDEDFKIDVISIGQYFLAYVTFSYLELALIGKGVIFIAIRILLQNATRIRVGGPTVRPSQVVYPQNAVVIMQQPGQVVYPVQYQQPIQQAYLYNQPANSGYQQQIPNQQQYQYNSKPALVPQQSYSTVPNSNEELKKNNNS